MNPSSHTDNVAPDSQSMRPNSALIVTSDAAQGQNRCPACGAQLAATATACDTCGVDLRAHALQLPSAARVAPRRPLPAFAAMLVTGAVLLGTGILLSQQLQAVAPQPVVLQQSGALRVTIYAPSPVPPVATETRIAEMPTPTQQVVLPTSAIPVIGDPVLVVETPLPAPTPNVAQESTAVVAPIDQKRLVAGRVRALQPKVNVRASARASAVVAIASNGDAVEVACAVQGDAMPNATGTEWYRVRVLDGTDGWIHASMIDVAGVTVAPCGGR